MFVLFGFRRLYLKSRVPDCQSGDPGAIRGSRIFLICRAPALRRTISKIEQAQGSTEATCHFYGPMAELQYALVLGTSAKDMWVEIPLGLPFASARNSATAVL